ncbi:MAG: DUF2203 domain-containing protein [Chloroflexi bacterium]|nr:DUF2203 domain-containing protein [Chloroflexota bacterium]
MRTFTIDEANALIPTLTAVLEDLRAVNERRERAVAEVESFERRAIQNGHGEGSEVLSPDNDLRTIHGELRERLLYLQGLGIHLKDIEHGIVDFPARMFGRDVYLCWRLGEQRIGFWHDIDAGYTGRRPL